MPIDDYFNIFPPSPDSSGINNDVRVMYRDMSHYIVRGLTAHLTDSKVARYTSKGIAGLIDSIGALDYDIYIRESYMRRDDKYAKQFVDKFKAGLDSTERAGHAIIDLEVMQDNRHTDFISLLYLFSHTSVFPKLPTTVCVRFTGTDVYRNFNLSRERLASSLEDIFIRTVEISDYLRTRVGTGQIPHPGLMFIPELLSKSFLHFISLVHFKIRNMKTSPFNSKNNNGVIMTATEVIEADNNENLPHIDSKSSEPNRNTPMHFSLPFSNAGEARDFLDMLLIMRDNAVNQFNMCKDAFAATSQNEIMQEEDKARSADSITNSATLHLYNRGILDEYINKVETAINSQTVFTDRRSKNKRVIL
jgi:hypothetical protein